MDPNFIKLRNLHDSNMLEFSFEWIESSDDASILPRLIMVC